MWIPALSRQVYSIPGDFHTEGFAIDTEDIHRFLTLPFGSAQDELDVAFELLEGKYSFRKHPELTSMRRNRIAEVGLRIVEVKNNSNGISPSRSVVNTCIHVSISRIVPRKPIIIPL